MHVANGCAYRWVDDASIVLRLGGPENTPLTQEGVQGLLGTDGRTVIKRDGIEHVPRIKDPPARAHRVRTGIVVLHQVGQLVDSHDGVSGLAPLVPRELCPIEPPLPLPTRPASRKPGRGPSRPPERGVSPTLRLNYGRPSGWVTSGLGPASSRTSSGSAMICWIC